MRRDFMRGEFLSVGVAPHPIMRPDRGQRIVGRRRICRAPTAFVRGSPRGTHGAWGNRKRSNAAARVRRHQDRKRPLPRDRADAGDGAARPHRPLAGRPHLPHAARRRHASAGTRCTSSRCTTRRGWRSSRACDGPGSPSCGTRTTTSAPSRAAAKHGTGKAAGAASGATSSRRSRPPAPRTSSRRRTSTSRRSTANSGVEHVVAVENYLAPEDLRHPRRRHQGIVIGIIAAGEHEPDLRRMELGATLERLLERHDGVRVVAVGADLETAQRAPLPARPRRRDRRADPDRVRVRHRARAAARHALQPRALEREAEGVRGRRRDVARLAGRALRRDGGGAGRAARRRRRVAGGARSAARRRRPAPRARRAGRARGREADDQSGRGALAGGVPRRGRAARGGG